MVLDNIRDLLLIKIIILRGAWAAQLVKLPTSTYVMISLFPSSSPTSGSVLTARSLEPVSDSVSPSLSPPPPPLDVPRQTSESLQTFPSVPG